MYQVKSLKSKKLKVVFMLHNYTVIIFNNK